MLYLVKIHSNSGETLKKQNFLRDEVFFDARFQLCSFKRKKDFFVCGQLTGRITFRIDKTTTMICRIVSLLKFHCQLDPRYSLHFVGTGITCKHADPKNKRESTEKAREEEDFFMDPKGP